jgi:hypothetical protein
LGFDQVLERNLGLDAVALYYQKGIEDRDRSVVFLVGANMEEAI